MPGELYTVWLPAANFVLTWGTALFVWVASRSKATSAHVASLELRLLACEQASVAGKSAYEQTGVSHAALDARVRVLENDIGTKPTHADIGQLYESIRSLAETVHRLVGETEQQSQYLRLLINNVVGRRENDRN